MVRPKSGRSTPTLTKWRFEAMTKSLTTVLLIHEHRKRGKWCSNQNSTHAATFTHRILNVFRHFFSCPFSSLPCKKATHGHITFWLEHCQARTHVWLYKLVKLKTTLCHERRLHMVSSHFGYEHYQGRTHVWFYKIVKLKTTFGQYLLVFKKKKKNGDLLQCSCWS